MFYISYYNETILHGNTNYLEITTENLPVPYSIHKQFIKEQKTVRMLVSGATCPEFYLSSIERDLS